MNELVHSLLQPDVALPVLAFLADVTLKSLLILALAGAVTSLLRRASATTRHLVWTLALCSVLVLPVLSAVGPSWHVLPNWSALTDRISVTPSSVVPEAPRLPLVPKEIADAPAATPAPPAPTPSPETPVTSPRNDSQNALWQALGSLVDAARQAHWSVWLLLLWGLGAMLVVGRLMAGAAGVIWMARSARPIEDPTWHAMMRGIGHQLGLDRSVQLLQSARASMPMTWGLVRPIILLPQGADDWSEGRKQCVLAHELAHVQRWDCLTQGLAQLACALVWWNPLCWVAARRMRIERELACDDHVLACNTRPSEYATHLLDVARTSRASFVSPIHAVSMARPSQLEGRILAILDPDRRRAALGRVTLGLAVGLAALLVVPVSALRPSSDALPEQSSPGAMLTVSEPSPDVIEWKGAIAPDATVEIVGGWGDVYVGPSEDATVRVRGYRASGGEDAQLQVTERGNALVLCTTTDDKQPCTSVEKASGTWGSRTQAQIDLKVLVPPSVRLQVHSVDGNISVAKHEQDVTAETRDGDISVVTTGYAQARTDDGNIHIEMGRTNWTGKLDVVTRDGDIEIVLPARPDVDVYAESQDGWVRSDFALKERRRAAGMLLWGAVGQGDRRLTLQTQDGAIALMAARDDTALTPDATAGPTWASLQDASKSVRIRVAEVLGREREISSVPLLSTLIRRDESPKVRKVAVWALGEIGASEGLPALTDALDDNQPTVRAKAAWAMGEIRDTAAGPALANAVRHDPDATVRMMAVWALGELGDERAVPVLRTALHDSDGAVREKARWALHEIGATVTDESEDDVEYLESETQRVRNLESTEALADERIDATIDGPRSAALIRRVLTNVGSMAREVALNEETLARLLRGEAPRASATYQRAMRAAGIRADDDDVLLMAQVLGVEPSYAQAVREAGYAFCLEEIIKLYLVDVSPGDLRTLSAAGYDDLDSDAIVQLHTYGVDGAYVQALASVGYRELCPDDLVAWWQHDVDRTFLRDLASVGYRDLCPEEVLALRVHGIDVAFVREHVGPGSVLPPIDEIVEMKLGDA